MADIEKIDEPVTSTRPPGLEPSSSVSQATYELVLSKDGFPLFPQPVLGDDLDPLNWSSTQKHTILAMVMSM